MVLMYTIPTAFETELSDYAINKYNNILILC